MPTAPPTRPCVICGQPIAPLRLEALPNIKLCIQCARNYPPTVDTSRLDLSEASPINRNGFAPKE